MAQIDYLDLGNQQHFWIWKLVGYFRNCDNLKIGCFCKIPKFMKTEDVKIDFSVHFLFQIFATDKPLEIDPWNQMQMIPWDLHFCRKKVPSENINPSLRKPYGLIWWSKIQNSPHIFVKDVLNKQHCPMSLIFVLVGDVCDWIHWVHWSESEFRITTEWRHCYFTSVISVITMNNAVTL